MIYEQGSGSRSRPSVDIGGTVKGMFDKFTSNGKSKGKRSPEIRDMRDAPYKHHDEGQQRIEEAFQPKTLSKKIGKAISRWFHSSMIPPHKAKDPYFKAMVKKIQTCGKNVKRPTPDEIARPYLDTIAKEVDEYIEEFKYKWLEYEVTIMCDGWSGPTRMSIINFLTYCDGKTIFHKSFNASSDIKDSMYLFKLMDEVVQEVGPDYVVPVVTDNASNFKKAGTLLMVKYPTLHWTPCAAHCIDLMFKDIGEMNKVQTLVFDAKMINFI
ncbi:uncharacterized protein LOC122093712 [Macadamia integrifolia]|uniref:uncharacterized protein LOC122093712 n=1 Tax=Macadamia integrifolia TaxID=60698 RepID=UPI001C4E50DF|nr:uncharacterized protein LOC122093712 [Macadamia integrifolia]